MDQQAIERGKSYRLPDFQRISGLGPDATREAVRLGLTVRKVGRRKYVTGDDFHAFLESRPVAPARGGE